MEPVSNTLGTPGPCGEEVGRGGGAGPEVQMLPEATSSRHGDWEAALQGVPAPPNAVPDALGPTFQPGLSPGEHLHHVSSQVPAMPGGGKRDPSPEKATCTVAWKMLTWPSLAQAGGWTVVTGETGVGGPIKLEPCTRP